MTNYPNLLREVVNQVYDTLMGNVGMTEFHTPFPTLDVDEPECDARAGIINFIINGISYRITIEEVEEREML